MHFCRQSKVFTFIIHSLENHHSIKTWQVTLDMSLTLNFFYAQFDFKKINVDAPSQIAISKFRTNDARSFIIYLQFVIVFRSLEVHATTKGFIFT